MQAPSCVTTCEIKIVMKNKKEIPKEYFSRKLKKKEKLTTQWKNLVNA
jgi:hypothetical protein